MSRHKNYLFAIVLLALALTGTAASAQEKMITQGVANDTVTIGMHTSLSGPAASYGVAYEQAAEMVFDQANAAGGINGRKIKLVVEDDRGDAGAGVAAVTKLLDRDRTFLIIGGNFTPVALAVLPRVIGKGVIYWSPSSSTPSITNPFHRLSFQAQVPNDEQATSVVKLALSMKPKTVSFIGENNEYGHIIHDATIQQLARHGMKPTLDLSIEANATSAATQVLQLRQTPADVVLNGDTPGALSLIIHEMYAQGIKAPLISFGGGATQSTFDLVTGEAPIEYYAFSPIACQLTSPCAAQFMADWKKTFPNVTPQVWGAHGYAVFQFFVDGLRHAGRDLTTEKLVQAFETMPAFKSPIIVEPMKFTAEEHRATHGSYLIGFKDGKQYFFGDEIH